MKVWNTITPLSPSLALYPSLACSGSLSLHLLWLQEKSVKGAAAEIFIDLFSSVLFISLSSLLALPSPLHGPRNTSSAARCQGRRRGWKSTTWNHYLAFVAPSSFTCVNKTKGCASVGWRQMWQQQQQQRRRHRLSRETGGLFSVFWCRDPPQGVVDRKHQGAVLYFSECKGSCTQLQAIEVVVVMATMPRAITITMVTVVVPDLMDSLMNLTLSLRN